ncbi:MAG: polyprenyl synthetase family protein [Desulfovibrio sp.]|uniref:polyprenyl synthetase family protein n=1 Tax=Desulfovibrio sp. 7SRBS1 TaxID=3378064 RepID=UPI003B3EE3DF
MTIKERIAPYTQTVEGYLVTCLEDRRIPKRLKEAMQYSLMAGGKRIRPVICLLWAELFGVKREHALPFAASIEMIHTYSLIHDDLPAMDDDDLRRGKPSNHKVFGEATAILAGDGLLTEAFVSMFEASTDIPAANILDASRLLAQAAGAGGMVGGQDLDMLFTDAEEVGIAELKQMHAMKTGAILQASCTCGTALAGAQEKDRQNAHTYGTMIGAAFQIVDDILDIVGDEKTLGKPVGSDVGMGKATYPSLLGLEESRELAAKYVEKAKECLAGYTGEQAETLGDLAQYIVDRAN